LSFSWLSAFVSFNTFIGSAHTFLFARREQSRAEQSSFLVERTACSILRSKQSRSVLSYFQFTSFDSAYGVNTARLR
jgi:hypothetical protein